MLFERLLCFSILISKLLKNRPIPFKGRSYIAIVFLNSAQKIKKTSCVEKMLEQESNILDNMVSRDYVQHEYLLK